MCYNNVKAIYKRDLLESNTAPYSTLYPLGRDSKLEDAEMILVYLPTSYSEFPCGVKLAGQKSILFQVRIL